jgi:hypothetical protein
VRHRRKDRPIKRIFGQFIEREIELKDYRGEHLEIGFSPTSVPIQQRWRTNGLSADFLADYLITFFPGDDHAAAERQAELKNAVSYVANELLENAMKFSYASSQHAISIAMYLEAEAVSLYVTNSVDPQAVAAFQQTIARLLTEDIDTLYMEQLMLNAESDSEDGSSMGYLTMLHDYGTTLAWKFAPLLQDPEVVVVTTMARLAV